MPPSLCQEPMSMHIKCAGRPMIISAYHSIRLKGRCPSIDDSEGLFPLVVQEQMAKPLKSARVSSLLHDGNSPFTSS